jgi:hypothetical protein
VKPLFLNYHLYTGEYPALLRSVKDQLSEARATPLTPVSANRYAAIVDGFFSARIDRLSDASWRISNRGALQTVRFDAAEGREVDLHSSVGVIGQKRVGSALYVALDETIGTATVVLVPSGAASYGSSVGLLESRWLLRHIVKEECGLRFEAQGYGDGSFAWFGAPSGRYIVAVDRADHEIWRQIEEADDEGRFNFDVPLRVRLKTV